MVTSTSRRIKVSRRARYWKVWVEICYFLTNHTIYPTSSKGSFRGFWLNTRVVEDLIAISLPAIVLHTLTVLLSLCLTGFLVS